MANTSRRATAEEEKKIAQWNDKLQALEGEVDDCLQNTVKLRKLIPPSIAKLFTQRKTHNLEVLIKGDINYEAPDRIDVEQKIEDFGRKIDECVDMDKYEEELKKHNEDLREDIEKKKRYVEFLENSILNRGSMPFLGSD